MNSTKNIISQESKSSIYSISKGDSVYINDKKEIFQVIGVDYQHQKCWVRRWPLLAHGSPVFEIDIKKISLLTSNN